MAYLEKDFQTDFLRWAKIIFRRTAGFELKLAQGNSIPFSDVRQHQQDALYHIKHNSMAYKIPDDAYSQKPLDCFIMSGQPAYVVVMFHGKQQHFYMIDIDNWIHEKDHATRKSLTEERAAEIGLKYDLSGSKPFDHTYQQPFVETRQRVS